MSKTKENPIPAEVPIILVHDADVVIEHHPEDWLAFALFWALAFIVFLQFFTRYILNDSLSWTEEVARYGLMMLTFLGAAIVVRKNTHIAVEVLLQLSPPNVARPMLALIDAIKLIFLALLFLFFSHDRGAHAFSAHDRVRIADEHRLWGNRYRMSGDAAAANSVDLAQFP